MTSYTKALSVIDSYDFSKVVNGAVRHGFDPRSAPEALKELKVFFAACARNEVSLSPPSQECDDLWHAFIIETRDYAAFCDAAFGGFLHHSSDVSPAILAESRKNALMVFGPSTFATTAECNDVRQIAA